MASKITKSKINTSTNNNSVQKPTNVVQCNECKKQVDVKTTICCVECKKKYEYDCIGISEKLYRLKGTEAKKQWKCKLCNSKIKNNKDTEESTNITLRKKPLSPKSNKIVSQTNVGFDSQSCDSPILTQMSLSTNESFLTLSPTERLSRSVECLTSLNNNIIELQENNDRLMSELLTTQNELENTIIENNELKRQICKLTTEITTLKGLCQSTISPKNTSQKKKKLPVHDKESTPISNKPYLPDNIFNNSPIEKDNLQYLHDKIKQLEKELANAKMEIDLLNKRIETLQYHNTSHTCQKKKNRKLNETNTSKLCFISSNNKQNVLRLLENSDLGKNHSFCHYIAPGGGIEQLLVGLRSKLDGYTKNDYCVIFIGESDFTYSQQPYSLVDKIRNALQEIQHTNIIIAVPTYIGGANIYNYRIENFNALLNNDAWTNKYAYIFDSNRSLTYDMLSIKTGKINNRGIKCIMDKLSSYIQTIQEKTLVSAPTVSNDIETSSLESLFFRE